MELALTIFAGLVLFAAFGKPVAKGLQAISPSLPGALGKLIGLIPWVTTPAIALFTYFLLAEQKRWEDTERVLFALAAFALAAVVRFLCVFVSGVLQAVDPVVKVVGKGIFAEDDAPPVKSDAGATFTIEGDEEGERWSVSFDDMRAIVGRDGTKETFLIKRTKEGEWLARAKKKGSEWESLEDVSERLSSVIETRWRKLVK